jgi:hypothetical protein
MPYRFVPLNDRLILIAWSRTPNNTEATQYIRDLTTRLDQAAQPLYFISDMRRGRIIDIHIIRRLSNLSRHANWAGSTAFTQNPISQIFGDTYQKMVAHKVESNLIFDEPAQAIAYLETLCPGLTADINWADYLS